MSPHLWVLSVLVVLIGRKINVYWTIGFYIILMFLRQCSFGLSRLNSWLLLMMIGQSLKGVETCNQLPTSESKSDSALVCDLLGGCSGGIILNYCKEILSITFCLIFCIHYENLLFTSTTSQLSLRSWDNNFSWFLAGKSLQCYS